MFVISEPKEMRPLPTIKLFSVFHKPAPVPAAKFVIPVQVGASLAAQKLDMLQDNTGPNISDQNPFFNELTASYWIWKNGDRTGIDAWGLCHYRRYFSQNHYKLLFIKRSRVYYELNQQNLDAAVCDGLYEKIQQLLQHHDVIVQRPVYAHKKGRKVHTIEEAYALLHDRADWQLTLNIVREKYPGYSTSIEEFSQQTKMSYYNMMVAGWNVWDDYLAWLFDILFELQKGIRISTDPYQARIFGFIAERLLNLYIYHNKLRPAYLTIALFER